MFGLHFKKGGNGRALTWESISEGSFPLETPKRVELGTAAQSRWKLAFPYYAWRSESSIRPDLMRSGSGSHEGDSGADGFFKG